MPTWDILICSIWHRTTMLDELLTELEAQQRPGMGIIVCRDNLQLGYSEKVNKLMDASEADYVCQIDDDDWISPDYASQISGALKQRPDYVGFRVKWTQDGEPMLPVEHSLKHQGWVNAPDKLTRDINHRNPMRRDLAAQAPWTGGNGADRMWANCIRSLDILHTETYVDAELYHYRLVLADTFTVRKEPLAEEPPMPTHKGVTWI